MEHDSPLSSLMSLYILIKVVPALLILFVFIAPMLTVCSFWSNIYYHHSDFAPLIERYEALNEEYKTGEETRKGGWTESFGNRYSEFEEDADTLTDAKYQAKIEKEEIEPQGFNNFLYGALALLVCVIAVIFYKSFFLFMWHGKWRILFIFHLILNFVYFCRLVQSETGQLKATMICKDFLNTVEPITPIYIAFHVFNIFFIALLLGIFIVALFSTNEIYYGDET